MSIRSIGETHQFSDSAVTCSRAEVIESAQTAIVSSTQSTLEQASWERFSGDCLARISANPLELEAIINSLNESGAPFELLREATIVAVTRNWRALRLAPKILQNDDEIARIATLQNKHAVEYLSREMILRLVKKNFMFLQWIPSELKSDPEVILAGYQQSKAAVKFASSDGLLAIIEQDPSALRIVPTEYRIDPKFIIEAYKRNVLALDFIEKNVALDCELFLEPIRQLWSDYQRVSDAFRPRDQAPDLRVYSSSSMPQFELETENPRLAEIASEVLSHVMQSDPIRTLFHEAFEATQCELPFKIKFVKRQPGDFSGYCDFHSSSIKLMDDLIFKPAHLIGILTFELTNAKRTSCFLKAYDAAVLGELSKEEYTKRYEEIEFENIKSHLDVCKKAITEMRWPASWIEEIEKLYPFPVAETDFPTYWEIIKDGAHAEFYRKNWESFPAFAEEVSAVHAQRTKLAEKFLSGTADPTEHFFVPEDLQSDSLQKEYDQHYPDASASSSAAVPSFNEFLRIRRQEALPDFLNRIRKTIKTVEQLQRLNSL